MAIRTSPPESRVIVDGKPIGESPVSFKNHKAVFAGTRISIRKEGYRGLDTVIRKSESWGFRYAPEYLFVLERLPDLDTATPARSAPVPSAKRAREADEALYRADESGNLAPMLVCAGIGIFLGLWWLTYAIAPADGR